MVQGSEVKGQRFVNSFPGYEGQLCDKEIDECVSSPCGPNGHCIDRVDSYQCVCSPGYKGANCQTDINECETQPCLNGGTCLDQLAK